MDDTIEIVVENIIAHLLDEGCCFESATAAEPYERDTSRYIDIVNKDDGIRYRIKLSKSVQQ